MPTKGKNAEARKRTGASFRSPKNFFDRELSWLAFNRRVLEEALDPTTPLLERLKFLGICSTNLDEFFMVRVSGVQEQIRSGVRRRSHSGLTPSEQFNLIHEEAHRQFDEMFECYREEILPGLERENIIVTQPSRLSAVHRRELRERFEREILPVLTPLAVDSGHPFPRLRGLSLNLFVRLRPARRLRQAEALVAIIQVPSVLPRMIAAPTVRERLRYVLLEDIITEFAGLLFPGMKVVECVPFRVVRDADIEYKEIEAEDLLKYIETEIRGRERGMAVQVRIGHAASPAVLSYLKTMLNLSEEQVYRINGPLAVNELAEIWKLQGRDDLREEPFTPSIRRRLRGRGSVFSKIREGDILVHHPYESFVPVVDFIEEAARDPKVLAIKQTLYRTSGDSPIIDSLIEAAENGKQVAALVELKARFDEENNIVWARRLEEAGVHVVYGLVGLKTHCKAALVVRREDGAIRRYVHLGTGNYNPTTARIYSDLGLFTCDAAMCRDASSLFNMLTGYSHSPTWERMIVAPQHLREKTLELIDREADKAAKGQPGRIRAKMNALVDQEIIVELYRASAAGVQIDLCVRGVCCLRPGVKGVSENIRVWSIVDRFLEHSRIFIFGSDGEEEAFLASADWMDRNMDRRIEVMFPIIDGAQKARCIETFDFCQRDTVKARLLGADGAYRRAKPRAGEEPFRSQVRFIELEEEVAESEKKPDPGPKMVPPVFLATPAAVKATRRRRRHEAHANPSTGSSKPSAP